MKLLVVLPVVDQETFERCAESIVKPNSAAGLTTDEILVVDNTRKGLTKAFGFRTYRDPEGHNLGVARSWNVGAKEVLDKRQDYLVIVSACIRFGPELHTTLKRQLEEYDGADIIEAEGHSWHLIAIHRNVFEKVGLFDSNFYPAYEESIDFCFRMSILDLEGGWPRFWVNAVSESIAHGSKVVSCPNPPLKAYYREKWCGDKGNELYTQPFGDKPLDYFEDVPIPELATKYNLKEWW